MPSLKAIRTRIVSVKSTQKITKAMKMVAAARLRRAQDGMMQARPYAREMRRMVDELLLQMQASPDDAQHPLLQPSKSRVLRIVLVTSDRGLAGAYNSNLQRRVERLIVDEKPNWERIELWTLGRKGREHFRRRGGVAKELPGATSENALGLAQELAHEITADFADGRVGRVLIVYNEFKSAISQVVRVEPLVPIGAPEKTGPVGGGDTAFEPSRGEVLTTLLPLLIQTRIFQALLEAVASELGARMSAMDSATKNAKEMISSLTLQFNRARQAAITKELMEIIGGAEALKG